MTIVKSITKGKIFKEYSKIKKQLNDCEMWINGDYMEL